MAPRSSGDPTRDKRRRILDAAYDVCRRRGVAGARMDEVAAVAAVSKGTLYRHFETKQALFLAAMLDSFEASSRALGPTHRDDSGDPLVRIDEILVGLTRALAAVASRMPVHYQAWGIVADDADARRRLQEILLGFFAESTAEIREAIRRAQHRGDFAADVDASAVTDGILALLGGFLYRASVDPDHADPNRLNACFDALIRGPFYATPVGEADDD